MKIKLDLRQGKLFGRGDTIVEVVVCIAVLAVTLGIAFLSTTHSLRVGTDSSTRTRALGLAQQQIEQVKYNEQSGKLPQLKSSAATGQHFCINPADNVVIKLDSSAYCQACVTPSGTVDQYVDPSKSQCPAADDGSYYLYLTYNSSNIFSASAQWTASNGSGQDQLALYYKAVD